MKRSFLEGFDLAAIALARGWFSVREATLYRYNTVFMEASLIFPGRDRRAVKISILHEGLFWRAAWGISTSSK